MVSFSLVSTAQTQSEDLTKAIAVLNPTQGSNVKGVVTFTREGDNLNVVADLEGLSSGKHGFHIHQYGDESAPDGKSAGDHFNPTEQRHGSPGDAMHHMGDMGNIEAGQDGKAHLEMTITGLSLNSIIGRSVVVHENEDDLMSQPAGNSGARLAVGVIGIAQK
ncbi:MAG: superoxide dismutase family protein [Ignavibacteria bacterium]|nr:superoxide dismutase family protein [Ignavibacteria bacterium]MCU7503405.1 superoxide dismutase family protein [Ignavibacteria bacterium]MCU7516263.1 superoxide dismutase family protein [Ignavibacteria bacterium]